jgi:hypothetical protein
VLVQRTPKGTAFIRDLRGIMKDAAKVKPEAEASGRKKAARAVR